MKSGVLWNQVVTGAPREFPGGGADHILADNCAMQLVRAPKQFDVIVTDNLFGDILSDVAAMLTGSLGMLPSASLGAPDADGRRKALYEPVHGSAPDIAGKGIANPIATIASSAWRCATRSAWGLKPTCWTKPSRARWGAACVPPIMQDNMRRVSTQEMGEAIIGALDELAA